MKTIDPSAISQKERHHYLLSAVAPRPICFASTVDKKGNVNLSPFSFFNVFSSSPPIMVFSPAKSGKDGSLKHTHLNVLEVKEVVINIVNHSMVEQMSLSSTAYDRGINEFVKAGFTEVESQIVKPPRVAEAPVAFECLVNDIIALGENPGAGNLVICEVKLIHINEDYLDASGKLETTRLDLVSRMGDNWYCRANGDALFEVNKPKAKKGIGFDLLPENIIKSDVLTGNNIARLAGLESLPTQEEINRFKDSESFLHLDEQIDKMLIAKKWIEEGKAKEAMLLLQV